MPKYFIKPEDIDKENGVILVSGENADHLITSMRTRLNDPVVVCDGFCVDYNCAVSEIIPGKAKRLKLKVISEQCVSEPRLKVTLYQALPKADKMEYVIQKCVEMGIYNITPIYTDNSDINVLSDVKLSRYRKISEASAKQSMRGIIPGISQPITLEQAIKESFGQGFVFAPYENERMTGLKDILDKNAISVIDSAAFFIGSEGGFSLREAEMFKNSGIPCVSLGPRILRTETAGFAVLAILMYTGNEFGVSTRG